MVGLKFKGRAVLPGPRERFTREATERRRRAFLGLTHAFLWADKSRSHQETTPRPKQRDGEDQGT